MGLCFSCAKVAALLGAGILCALISNTFAGPSRHLGWLERPAAVAESTQENPSTDKPAESDILESFAADPTQPIRDLDSANAWELYRAKVPFVDARRSDEYISNHIAGAWNIPVWESSVDAAVTRFEAKTHPTSAKPLVLYCNGGDCEDSHILASKLVDLGYRNLFIYRGGFPDWAKERRPVKKGSEP